MGSLRTGQDEAAIGGLPDGAERVISLPAEGPVPFFVTL